MPTARETAKTLAENGKAIVRLGQKRFGYQMNAVIRCGQSFFCVKAKILKKMDTVEIFGVMR
jgi:hypothetical protein